MQAKRLVGLQELAQIVGLSPSHLRIAYRRAGMPHIRAGNRVLFDPGDVIDWLKGGHGRDLNRHRREEHAQMLEKQRARGGKGMARAAS